MDDRILQPAFAVYNSPGVYALLLGSGISRSAEIMTGGEILDDLIRQIATAKQAVIETTPIEWYTQHFNQTPGYDMLLHQLGKTQLDRRALLEKNFVPDETDLEEGRKQPTKAHDAIAWLVQQGYIRVIITTNFDRLMEMALERIGIIPSVISSDEDAQTHLEPRHAPITILKIHGDYLSANLRNTPEELSNYNNEPHLFKWLKDTVSEYGLIIAGWSGITDKGLVELLESHKARHGSFWISFEEPNENANRIIQTRSASLIKNLGADDFFGELREMVEALRGRENLPPLTVDVAVTRVRKMVARPEMQPELENFLIQQYNNDYKNFTSQQFYEQLPPLSGDANRFMEIYTPFYCKTVEISLASFITLSNFGNSNHTHLLKQAIERWAETPEQKNLQGWWISYLPGVLMLYGIGISAINNGKWDFLKTILVDTLTKPYGYNAYSLSVGILSESFTLEYHRKANNRRMFVGFYIKSALRKYFIQSIPSDDNFDFSFSLLEMLISITYIHEAQKGEKHFFHQSWMPPHIAYGNGTKDKMAHFWQEAAKSGNNWELLTTNFCDGKAHLLLEALKIYYRLYMEMNKSIFSDNNPPNYPEIYASLLE